MATLKDLEAKLFTDGADEAARQLAVEPHLQGPGKISSIVCCYDRNKLVDQPR